MRDDACCDFYGQEIQNPDIEHRQANRIGRCAMMHVVIFWPLEYKARYRTSTGESNLCLPNEDFGKRNSRSGVSFRVILRAFVAQIEYSHPRKVARKDTPDLLFRFPKSSFGRHIIADGCNTRIRHRPIRFEARASDVLSIRVPIIPNGHKPAACYSSPILTNRPLHDFPQLFQPQIVMLPTDDFGKRNSRSGVSFRRTLRGCEYSIWATNTRKVPRKHTPDLLFRFPKSSFGRHKNGTACRVRIFDVFCEGS